MRWKTLFAATIALALAGSGVVYAQKPSLPEGRPGRSCRCAHRGAQGGFETNP